MEFRPYRVLLGTILGMVPLLPAHAQTQADCALPADGCRAPQLAAASSLTLPGSLRVDPLPTTTDVPTADSVGAGAAAAASGGSAAELLPAPTVSLSPTNQYSLSVASWSATVGYSTPVYTSMDVPRSVSLFYASGVAKPLGYVQVEATDDATQTPTRMSLVVKTYSGTLVTENFYVGAHGTSRLSAQWDASALSTGTYNYVVSVRSWWSDGTYSESTPQTVRVLILNPNDAIAPGWTVVGTQHLFGQPTGGPAGLTIAHGDGTAAFFEKVCDPTCRYIAPANDFSTLVLNTDNTFTRTYPDGGRTVFTANGLISYSEDRFGNRTSYGWGWTSETLSRPVPTSVTDPAGKVTVLSYGDGVHLSTITDPTGRASTFTYSTAGDITQVTAPDGVIVLGVAYTDHRAISWWNRASATTSAFYDFNNRLAVVFDPQVTLADGSSVYPKHMLTTFETASLPLQNQGTSSSPSPRVDPSNLEMVVTDPRGNTTAMALTSTGNPWRIRDALGRTSYIGWNAASQPIRTLSHTGAAVSYYWSGMDLVKTWNEVTGDTAHYEYGPYHQPTYSSVPGSKEWRTYDGNGTLASVRDQPDSTKATRYYFGSTNPGRIEWVRDPGGHETHYTYGDSTTWFNLAETYTGVNTLRYTRYRYDAYKRVSMVISPQNDTTRTSYDVLNRVTSTTDAAGAVTTYVNGAVGVDSIRDARGQGYRFYRNAIGWTTGEKDPLGWTTSYAYDANGNVLSQTDRNNKTITATYDALNRVSSRTADSLTTYWRYDPSERWAVVQNATSTDSASFDLAGQLVSTTTKRGSLSYTIANTYTAGMRTLMTASGPWTGTRTVRYHFDASLRLDSLTDLGGGVTTKNYTEEGLPISTLLPSALGTNYSFTSAHLNSLTQYTNGITSLGGGYALNANGYVSRFRNINGDTVRDFTYDRAGRLKNYTDSEVEATNWVCAGNKTLSSTDPDTGSCTPLGALGELDSQTFTYDAVGNRTDLSAQVGTGNRLNVFVGYNLSYDGEGNQTRKVKLGTEVKNYTWNALGQLTAVRDTTAGTTSYAYDGMGRRVRRTAPNGTVTEYLYDGDDLLMELDANGTPIAEYTYYPGVDNPHSMRRGGSMYYYATDNVGTVTGLTNASRQVVNLYRRNPWGFTFDQQETVANSLGFMGREYDATTNLYNFRARWYDPLTGRFISQDPIGLAGGINPYAFVGNNPVNFTDPSGLECTIKELEQAVKDEKNHVTKPAACGLDPIGVTVSPAPPRGCRGQICTSGPGVPGMPPGQIGSGGKREGSDGSDETTVLQDIGDCALDHFGLGDLAVRGVSWVGAVPISKVASGYKVLGGASKTTNLLNVALHESLPAAKLGTRILGTSSAWTLMGRANVLLSVGLLAYDVTSIALCAYDPHDSTYGIGH